MVQFFKEASMRDAFTYEYKEQEKGEAMTE